MKKGNLWIQAKSAVKCIAPFVCKADPDGITMYAFSSRFRLKKFKNIDDPNKIEHIFNKCRPKGSSDLAHVLRSAFKEHFKTGPSPTTILVITDGKPNNKKDVRKAIISAANKIHQDDELSVTFVQIGNDPKATNFLIGLDDDLTSRGAAFDIVDRVTVKEMQGMSFEEFINKSIDD
eukprot:TRINITY_DN346_c0_g1_i2.p2 TRINITY_DN346_c0_g1~~TRINITY_DN346_c0_g1_i2.p2  ORF type:complete len:177 (+),score=59.91 TRINITY_DN346_c0_g1_i2:667-1197(+)